MLRYAITDRHLFPGDERLQADALARQAHRLADARVDLLQVREKDLPDRQLETLAHTLRHALDTVHHNHTRLLLNGPAHIAVAARADGLHLRSASTPADIERVREAFAVAGLPKPLLSLSCHSLEDVRNAAHLGLDLLLLGPIFEKRVRGSLVAPGLGLACLRQAAHLHPANRILALGGVTEANTPACLEAGAAGIAGIRLFL